MNRKITKTGLPTETVDSRIFIIRGRRVILDKDLAELYGVPTKRLNEQVKRNRKKFPSDFMFQLTLQETQEWLRSRSQIATASKKGFNLRSQFATSSSHGGRRYLPYAFTEHGALMAANILDSERAVTMSIYVIRAFIRLREIFTVNQILEERLGEIEKVLLDHDVALEDLFNKIKLLLEPVKTNAVGFDLATRRLGKIG